MGGSVPFEQTAMECCLKYVCHELHESVHNVEPRLRTVSVLSKDGVAVARNSRSKIFVTCRQLVCVGVYDVSRTLEATQSAAVEVATASAEAIAAAEAGAEEARAVAAIAVEAAEAAEAAAEAGEGEEEGAATAIAAAEAAAAATAAEAATPSSITNTSSRNSDSSSAAVLPQASRRHRYVLPWLPLTIGTPRIFLRTFDSFFHFQVLDSFETSKNSLINSLHRLLPLKNELDELQETLVSVRCKFLSARTLGGMAGEGGGRDV